MRLTRTEEATYQRTVDDGYQCDGCGMRDPHGYDTVTVTISIHEGEEGGGVDEYHYCDDCLVQRAEAFVAAGSRAPIVAGWPAAEQPEGSDR